MLQRVSESQIEARIERMINRYDRDYMRGRMSNEEYARLIASVETDAKAAIAAERRH